jgi:Txe/YoeB family toxin of Txe-Axe toxin-antitoxin module
MKLLFTAEALSSFNDIKKTHSREADLIKEVLKDMLAHPSSGEGNPVPLSGKLSGLWKRDYGAFRELVYGFNADEVKVYAICKSLAVESTPSLDLRQSDYTEEEYRSVLAQMEANRGKGATPKVGIFWYSEGRNELFGVVSHPVDDYSRANASDGRITCSELHEDVWKKEFYRQRYKGDGTGLFIGQYQDKPRGRVFYNINDDTFEVACGKWLQQYPHVYDMILQEFDLPADRTSAKYAVHWDIGQSWR